MARASRVAVLGMVVEARTYITDANANSTHIERRDTGSITMRHSAYALMGARGMRGGKKAERRSWRVVLIDGASAPRA